MGKVITVDNAGDLVKAVNGGSHGDTINIAPGTYVLAGALTPRTGMTIKGAGITQTILQPAPSWNPYKTGLPYGPAYFQGATANAHVFNLGGRWEDRHEIPWGNDSITISAMTLDGKKQLHGALFCWDGNYLEMSHLLITNYTWAGVRMFSSSNLSIHDCEFINVTADGFEGGGIYGTWISDSEFYNNQMYYAQHGVWYGEGEDAGNYYGIKGRGFYRCRIHHNTIMVNFSIELPFEFDEDVEIDHNVLWGWISVPRVESPVPSSGVTFHIHHNLCTRDCQIECPRNGIVVNHNLFESTKSVVVGWLHNVEAGPMVFHDNLIKDPDYGGVFELNGDAVNNVSFYNNHIRANEAKSRTESFFNMPGNTNWNTITVKDNIIECFKAARPLFREPGASKGVVVENNTLTNVSDANTYSNASTNNPRGLTEHLHFICGAPGNQYVVDQWTSGRVDSGTTDLRFRPAQARTPRPEQARISVTRETVHSRKDHGIRVFSLQGAHMAHKQGTGNQTIDLSRFPGGTYIIAGTRDGRVMRKRTFSIAASP